MELIGEMLWRAILSGRKRGKHRRLTGVPFLASAKLEGLSGSGSTSADLCGRRRKRRRRRFRRLQLDSFGVEKLLVVAERMDCSGRLRSGRKCAGELK